MTASEAFDKLEQEAWKLHLVDKMGERLSCIESLAVVALACGDAWEQNSLDFAAHRTTPSLYYFAQLALIDRFARQRRLVALDQALQSMKRQQLDRQLTQFKTEQA